jgi:hypothetical protein
MPANWASARACRSPCTPRSRRTRWRARRNGPARWLVWESRPDAPAHASPPHARPRRPASDSETWRIKSRFAEPVSRKRPALRFRSIARFTPRGIEHVEVVQRAVKPFALNELLGQGALAGLPRARDHNSRHHRQPLGEGAADQTGKSIHGVDDFHSPHECFMGGRWARRVLIVAASCFGKPLGCPGQAAERAPPPQRLPHGDWNGHDRWYLPSVGIYQGGR